MIILDLEWNSGCYDKIRLDEVLQIGAVKVERLGGRIADTFCAHIRPKVHKRYSPAAKLLPALGESLASELDFPAAVQQFFDWCGDETEYGSWGGDDFSILRKNLDYWGVSGPLPETILDLQWAFGQTLGTSNHVALYRAAEYCLIPTPFDFHDALNDAVYTAVVGEFIRPETLEQCIRTPGVKAKKGALDRPDGAEPWRGPFDSLEQALNNRGSRLAVCPECGAKQRVGDWRHIGDGAYYSKFSCAEHGAYLLRLELKRDSAQSCWTSTQVISATPEQLRQLRGAKQGTLFRCEGKGRARRGRARRGHRH
jgi:inhibitor of KinA sporulation pathway (predicted exonuclease)